MGTSKPQHPISFSEPPGDRLDSWKEIAAYLKRDERTVRRWEKEGLPVHRKLHKKQASIFAYKAEIDAWWNSDRQRLEPLERPTTRKRAIRWLLAGLIGAGVLVLGALKANSLLHVRWARNQALPQLARLLDQGKVNQAFRLTLEAERYIPNDPLLERLVRDFTVPVSLQTTPPGAEIYMRTYAASDEEWTFLGKSPISNLRIPWDYSRWKIAKPGYGTIEAAATTIPNMTLSFQLDNATSIPLGMVHVPGGTFQFRSADPVELAPYWLDKYEVSNRKFAEFVNRGGYQNRTYWKYEFLRDGRALMWEDAMAQFRDSTGQPGPSTWELGSYPQDQADFPVSGVSWYEAAAYCESVGKSLPTIYHWYKAAGLGIDSEILHFSNFSGKGPARVGNDQGLGPYGTYDMAGNVKEWTWNASGAKRYILGGLGTSPAICSPYKTLKHRSAALPRQASAARNMGLLSRPISPAPSQFLRATTQERKLSRNLSSPFTKACTRTIPPSWTREWKP